MIKILFFIPTLGHGGAERVLVNLVNHMDLSKFDITIQTMFDVGIYQKDIKDGIRYKGGLRWYFRGNTKVFKLFTPEQLYKMYIHEDYDIIVSYLEGPSARIISGCTNPNTKLVSWIHVEQEKMDYVLSVFRNEQEARRCYHSFDKIVCVSETVKRDFAGLFSCKAEPVVLYNTVEVDVIKEKMKEKVDDIVFSSDEINICSVAKLMKVKGYDRLVRIQRRLREDGFPTHVYIVGKGEEKETLEEMIWKYSLQDSWTFVGFKTNPYKYVAASDLYVCSSYREGFSTAVTESIIVGTPVVSTNCSGAKELLGENDEYGIVTENDEESLYQGIKKMLEETGLLEFYKNQTVKRAQKFCVEATVSAVEQMLEEIL